jgi:PTS system nitrogen regulatory IIA component
MNLAELLDPDCIIANLSATSKKLALQELAKRAAELTSLHERAIFDVLLERERLGTTGVGNGIAIPHGKLPGLDRIYGVFARLEAPIDFDAVDDKPVSLVFLLLTPETAGADHLKALTLISRLLRDQRLCEELHAAKDASALRALLRDNATSQAA